jgi:hypothetical protein
LRIWGESRHTAGVAAGIRGIAVVDVVQGRFGRAAKLLAAAEALRRRLGAAVPPCEQPSYDQAVAAIRVGLGNDAFAEAWQDGGALGLDAASDVALEIQREELPVGEQRRPPE